MAEPAQVVRDKFSARTMAAVQLLLDDYRPRDFAVELWDGTRLNPEPGQFCRFTWRINNPGVLRAMLRSDRQIALGEAYIYGDFDIEGDIVACFSVGEHLATKDWTATEKLRLGSLLLGLPLVNRHEQSAHFRGRLHSKSRDRAAITFHYDVSNDFYKLWLDPAMVYSCAYFKSVEDSLETAQRQKLDYICKKLRLKPGERLLDIGCGWGGLVLHAARHCDVEAVGITLSEQQLTLARQRIEEAGLSSHCDVRVMDYRDATVLGTFDKLVSVGMVEHVGKNHLSEYFDSAFSLLRKGGVFLNHGIGRSKRSATPESAGFIKTYVFPDSDLVPISTMLETAEQAGFEVRDVENLREHYFLTLCHWVRRLEAHESEARELVRDLKYRTWHLYMAGCAHYMQTGDTNLYQSLLLKNESDQRAAPLTREDWYS